jgi:hypothetical protein
MPLKRIIFLFLLGALLVPLGGCVYLRLLEVKHQLADFEKHCVLENRDALAVIFLNPVLQKEDILHLAKRGPTFVEDDPLQAMWQYHFTKVYPSPQEGEGGVRDVPVRLHFQENKVRMGTLPEPFYRLMPRAFLVEALRAVGRARVNPVTRYGRGEFYESREKWETPIPRKQDFLELLGRPYSEEIAESTSTLTFVYRLQRSGPDSGPPTEARTRLTFLKGVEDLVEAEAKFAGMGFSLSLRKGKGS